MDVAQGFGGGWGWGVGVSIKSPALEEIEGGDVGG